MRLAALPDTEMTTVLCGWSTLSVEDEPLVARKLVAEQEDLNVKLDIAGRATDLEIKVLRTLQDALQVAESGN
jgi:hypothetical protein